jgi:hypothetical protein
VSTAIQNNSYGFVAWCQHETNNSLSTCPRTRLLLELARRILVLFTGIIPLIALISLLSKGKEIVVPSTELRDRITTRMPYLSELMNIYQSQRQLSPFVYQFYQRQILVMELGFDEMNIHCQSIDLIQKIRQKLSLENTLFIGSEISPQNTRLLGHLLVTEGHTSASVVKNGINVLCPEYDTNGELLNLSRPLSPRTLETYTESYRVSVPETISENRHVYRGKIPSSYSGSLEACVALLAYMLPSE